MVQILRMRLKHWVHTSNCMNMLPLLMDVKIECVSIVQHGGALAEGATHHSKLQASMHRRFPRALYWWLTHLVAAPTTCLSGLLLMCTWNADVGLLWPVAQGSCCHFLAQPAHAPHLLRAYAWKEALLSTAWAKNWMNVWSYIYIQEEIKEGMVHSFNSNGIKQNMTKNTNAHSHGMCENRLYISFVSETATLESQKLALASSFQATSWMMSSTSAPGLGVFHCCEVPCGLWGMQWSPLNGTAQDYWWRVWVRLQV